MQPATFVESRPSGRDTIRFSFVTLIGAAVLCLLLVGSSLAAARVKPYERLDVRKLSWEDIGDLPDGQQRIDRELLRQREYARRWHLVHETLGSGHLSAKSKRDLARRGLGPALLDKDASLPGTPAALGGVDTLKVLIIRFGFETNRNPGLTTIQPDGDFQLEPLTDPQPIEVDPPPHDKAYFEAHLSGLSEYYKFMSGGRLHIEGTVLPEADDDSYKLTDVADYGPGSGGFWSLDSLERLVRDMMAAADDSTQADGSVNLADYDDDSPFTYIIFVHAGSDWQSDINGDSPNDIPTFFVTLGEPQALTSINGTTGMPGMLSECSIIPETTNTDDFPGSIAAAFYHEFGHALGLPDVYNTRNGLPAVGIWDLMDSGTNLPVTMGTITDEGDTVAITATGVLPPSISAWCKYYLGWLEMGETDGRTGDYLLPAVGVPREQYAEYRTAGKGDFRLEYPQGLKAGTSSREWFLLENRWVPLGPGETIYSDLRFERDEETGVILYLAGETGAGWRNSGLYDYWLPAGGVLVWHVNNDQIAAGMEDNSINYYRDGLILVEADGIQDIGVLEAYVLGWYGSYRDPFGGRDFSGSFTPYRNLYVEGFPSSRNFDRSWSGLQLNDIRPKAPQITSGVMRFTGSVEPLNRGWPWEAAPVDSQTAVDLGGTPSPRPVDQNSVTPVVLRFQPAVVFADDVPDGWTGNGHPGALYTLGGDGKPLWTAPAGLPSGAVHPLDSGLAGPPAALPDPAGGYRLYHGSREGTVGALYIPDYQAPSPVWERSVADSLAAGPQYLVGADDKQWLMCSVFPDSLLMLDTEGVQVGTVRVLETADAGRAEVHRLAALPAPEGGSDLAVAVALGSWFLVSPDSNGVPEAPEIAYGRQEIVPPFHLAVVPGRSGSDLHVYDTMGWLGSWSVTYDGTVQDIGPVLDFEGVPVADPAVADMDGDGLNDLVVLTPDRVHAFKDGGIAVRGFPVKFHDLFPLADTTGVAGPVVVADATGDGKNEVFFQSSGGHLMGLGPTGSLLPQLPFRWGDNGPSGLAVGGTESNRVLWLLSRGGYTEPPMDRRFVNGRVSGYGLESMAPESERTNEWTGPGGGSTRRGPTGIPKDLGASAPFAQEMDQIYLYPNPLSGETVQVRFYSYGDGDARFDLYNLQGELIRSSTFGQIPGTINEYGMDVPGLASGMYVARLVYTGSSGQEIKTMTLAVEK